MVNEAPSSSVKASQVIQTKKLPQTPGTSKPSEVSGKMKKPKKMIRVAGGQVWEDASLQNWDHNDFRLFCGDLGNDVTDEVTERGKKVVDLVLGPRMLLCCLKKTM